MKRFLALSLIGTSFFIGLNRLNAEEYDAFGIDYSGDASIGNRIYGVDTSDGSKTLLTSKVFDNNSWSAGTSYVSATTGEIMIRGGGSRYHAYNWKTDTWRDVTDNAGLQAMFEKPASFGIDSSTVQIGSDANDVDVVEDGLNIDGAAVITKNSDGSVQIGGDTDDIDIVSDGLNIDGGAVITKNSDGSVQIGGDTDDIDIVSDGLNIDGAAVITKNSDGSVQIGGDTDDIDIVSDGLNIDGAAVITKNSDGSIQIGADGNDIDITAEGLTVDGVSLITKKESGEIHIGKNSLITKEEDGVQKLYAQDENGDAININVTEGTKLLIDGVEVQTGNTTQVTTNKNNISTNTSNISSNDTDIAANSSSITTNTSNISSNDTDISSLQSLISTKSGSTTTARIGDSTKNTLEIGGDTNPTTINQEGISVGGSNLIKKQSNGDIHIGKNSFVIGNDVLDGAHPIWAEDENGTKIPLNIYGSDLQINGVSVQGQINTNKSNIKNLGEGVAGSTALTTALTALPQTSKESKLSCGVGTGAYSSRYAVGFGCASKLNERLDINAGGSYVFGGSKSYGEGTLDSGVVKAGFVFKLGELNKPTQISMKDKKVMETKIESLEEKNKKILSKNQKLENKLSILMARLEKIEKIAFSESKSKDIAVYKLK